MWPHSRQSRTPAHGLGFAGGMNRFLPAVDPPYGTPLNTLIPSTLVPRILPAAVSTMTSAPLLEVTRTGEGDEARLCFESKGRTAPLAAANEDCLRNCLRVDAVTFFVVVESFSVVAMD